MEKPEKKQHQINDKISRKNGNGETVAPYGERGIRNAPEMHEG